MNNRPWFKTDLEVQLTIYAIVTILVILSLGFMRRNNNPYADSCDYDGSCSAPQQLR